MAWCMQRISAPVFRLCLKEVLHSTLPSFTSQHKTLKTVSLLCKNVVPVSGVNCAKLETQQSEDGLPQKETVELSKEPDGQLSKSETDAKFSCLYDGISDIHVKPTIPSKSSNLVPYVNESETLQNLLKLGVDLSKVEKHPEDASYIAKMDFEKDVKPYLKFLLDVGIPANELGTVITKNPNIFRQDLDHLQVRLNYLASKRFTADAIARIVAKAPQVLSKTTKDLDKQLGYYQKEFRLTGDQVRYVITRYPKLTTASLESVKEMKFSLKEYMGYTEGELKQLFLECPRLYLRGRKAVKDRFSYLYNDMKISPDVVMKWPGILSTRVNIIRQRHQFLKHLSRDQFDPKKPNFVSLKTLVTGTDAEFCQNVAKVPVSEYNNFLKML